MYKSLEDHASSQIREKLKLKSFVAKDEFAKKHPHAKSFLEDAGIDLGKIREHAAHILTAGTIGSAVLLGSTPAYAQSKTYYLPEPLAKVLISSGSALPAQPQPWMIKEVSNLLPATRARPLPVLSPDLEKVVGKVIQRATKIPAVPVLEGERLNTVYGYIGAEQHLPRFAGDSIKKHDELQNVGITKSRGAFGYFASAGGLTEEAITREKYYVAVQTLYLPNWSKRAKYLKDWYKWRKVIIVNPENGRAVIAVVGDAGPAAWTGKQFGGSPEVMEELGGKRYKKGRVLLYFVDDPQNKVALGPVKYQVPDVVVIPTPYMQEQPTKKPSKTT